MLKTFKLEYEEEGSLYKVGVTFRLWGSNGMLYWILLVTYETPLNVIKTRIFKLHFIYSEFIQYCLFI